MAMMPMGYAPPQYGYAPPYNVMPPYPPGSYPQQQHHGHGGRGGGKYVNDGRDRRMGGHAQGDSATKEERDEGPELRFSKFQEEGPEKPNGHDEKTTAEPGQDSAPVASTAAPITSGAAPYASVAAAHAPTSDSAGTSQKSAPVATYASASAQPPAPMPPAATAQASAPPAAQPTPSVVPPAPAAPPTFAEKVAASIKEPSPAAAAPSGPTVVTRVPEGDKGDKPKRGFGGGASAEPGEWSRLSSPRETGSAPPAFGSARNGNSSSSPTSGGSGAGGWKRGEAIHADSLLPRDDGVKRYDKATLIGLWVPKKVCPERIKEMYPKDHKVERQPLEGAKMVKQQSMSRTKSGQQIIEPHPDEAVIFVPGGKEGTFRYQPTRLSDTTDPAVILSKAKLILNKLSVTNFDKLSDEYMSVGLDSEELMSEAVKMIVQKAQVEEHFCFMYADLCRKITDQWSTGTSENEESLGKSFRIKLLAFCRDEYGRNRPAELEVIRNMDCSPEEKDEKEMMLKKRYTGTMRFIGEIYIKKLVSHSVMHNCISELIQAQEEETLECMCKLLRTIGSKFEADDAKKKSDKVAEYFEAIVKMSAEHPSSRMRFMFKDLLDLRKSGWVERRETEKAVKLGELRVDDSAQGSKGSHSRTSSSTNLSGKSQDARKSQEALAPDEWQTIPVSKSKSKSGTPALGVKEKPSGFGSKSSTATSNSFSALSTKQANLKSKDASGKNGGKDSKGKSDRSDKHNNSSASAGNDSSRRAANEDDIEEEGIALDRTVSFGVQSDSSERGDSPRGLGTAGAGGDPVEKSVIELVKRIIANFFVTTQEEEAAESIQDAVHPDGMSDIIKPCILVAFDHKDKDRESLASLFIHLHAKGSGHLRTDQVARGFSAFLDDLDETAIDVPMAVSIGRSHFANHSSPLFWLTRLHQLFSHPLGCLRRIYARLPRRKRRYQPLISHATP